MTEPTTQPNTAQPVALDPQVVNLAKAIRQQESNNNFEAAGDYVNGVPTSKGAYQFQDKTWKGWAGQYLGDSNAVMSPSNQNAVAYAVISDWKKQGLNPAQIAAKWNSGHEVGWENMIGTNPDTKISYNVPAYVNKVMQNYQQFKAQTPLSNPLGLPTAEASDGSQLTTENKPWTAGGFVENIFNSGANLIGGLADAAIHPVKTVENIANIAQGAIENTSNMVAGTKFDDETTKTAQNVGTYFKNRYGGSSLTDVLGHIANTAYTDPVGMALDVSTLLDGVGAAVKGVGAISDISRASQISKAVDMIQGAKDLLAGNVTESSAGMVGAMNATKEAGTVSQIGEGISTAAKYTNPLTPIVKTVQKGAEMAGSLAKTGVSQVTGLNRSALDFAIEHPEELTKEKILNFDRGNLTNDFGESVNELASGKGAIGAEYAPIIKSGAIADISASALKEIFAKNGLDAIQTIDKDGNLIWKINPPGAGTTLSSADVSKFEDVLNRFGKDKLNAGELINAKQYISENLANYEGKTSKSTHLADEVRGVFEKAGDNQIPGLKELDAKMRPTINLWNKIKKEFLNYDTQNKTWVLKDGAASKIANALKKPELLKAMEQVRPGIAMDIERLQAIEGIEKAMDIKTGTYLKAGLQGTALLTGNMPLVVGMILAHPTIAIKIIRGFGYTTKATVIPILAAARKMLGALPEGAASTVVKAGVIGNTSQNNSQSQ